MLFPIEHSWKRLHRFGWSFGIFHEFEKGEKMNQIHVTRSNKSVGGISMSFEIFSTTNLWFISYSMLYNILYKHAVDIQNSFMLFVANYCIISISFSFITSGIIFPNTLWNVNQSPRTWLIDPGGHIWDRILQYELPSNISAPRPFITYTFSACLQH